MSAKSGMWTWLALTAPFFWAAGCNTLIGATDPITREEDSSVGQACVLNSDCSTVGEICIFRVCSSPCRTDSDCLEGSRCLQTQVGTACVADALAACGPSQPCPMGSSCQAGFCRNTCGADLACLSQQMCVTGVCLGIDPTHDPVLAPAGSDASIDQTLADVGANRDALATIGDAREASFDAVAEGGFVADAADASAETSTRGDARAEAGCSLGARQCIGQQPQTCVNDSWANQGAPCSFVCDPAIGCKGVCLPGMRQCNGSTPQTCGPGGTWLSGGPCVNVCVSGACAGACMPGAKQCSGSIPQTCNPGGTWTDAPACSGTTPVCSSGACVACTTGTQCAGTTVQSCTNNQWVNQTTCSGPSPICLSGACVACTTGTQCSSNTPQTCVNNQWQNSAPCSGPTPVCSSGACVACTMGTQCSGNTPQTCVNGHWHDEAPCTGATPQCLSGACAACASGTRCNGNTVQSCSAGTWVDQMACTGGTPLCRSSMCVASPIYDIGNSTQFTDPDQESPDFLTLMPVTVAFQTKLLRFGVFGRSAGGQVVMVIYSDSAGYPGSLIMSSIPASVTSGPVESPVASATDLTPGRYWIGGVYSANTNTWFKLSPGPTAYYANDPYVVGPPPVFPVPSLTTAVTSVTYNYYIVVQDH